MRILFTVTLFLSSALLFLVQPMIAKMILPRFGGSPGVWNTSMLFFQAALLLGYAYAHVATKLLGPRIQAAAHVAVLLLPLLVLPIALPSARASAAGSPALMVLAILALTVGGPFLIVSAGAPLLQRWFAATDDPHGRDPYFLYSASNLGSMIALLAYPLLLEPNLTLQAQSRLWSYGYFALVALMALCAVAVWLRRGAETEIHEAPPTMPPEASGASGKGGALEAVKWIALAFCPSSLLLGVTTYLTSNIAPVPLLWVVPLALYLLTFIVAFARRPLLSTRTLGRLVPLLVIPLAFAMVLEASEPEVMVPLVILHLAAFVVVALMCHGELANRRPRAERLTEFYLYVSLGGVLGGVFNALLAPTLFNSFFEYPLVLAIACFFRPAQKEGRFGRFDWIYPIAIAAATALIVFTTRLAMPEPTRVRSAIMIGLPLILVFVASDRPFRFAASLAAVFILSSALQVASGSLIIEARRSFFGVHRVEAYHNQYGIFHGLLHGNTVHGRENFGALKGVPLTYYHPDGPIGHVFRTIGPSRRHIALVGLGIGSLAAYGQPGQEMTYYEIDSDVVAIAEDPRFFDFVANCRAKLSIKVGDARLTLAEEPAGSLDLIVLDAFSSDSIPVHLLTAEAIRMYLSKLLPGGVIAFHISNRYLDLAPVLANAASALGLHAWIEEDIELDAEKAKFRSTWVVMARGASDVEPLLRADPNWDPLFSDPSAPLWTDDYSNILSVLKVLRPALR